MDCSCTPVWVGKTPEELPVCAKGDLLLVWGRASSFSG